MGKAAVSIHLSISLSPCLPVSLSPCLSFYVGARLYDVNLIADCDPFYILIASAEGAFDLQRGAGQSPHDRVGQHSALCVDLDLAHAAALVECQHRVVYRPRQDADRPRSRIEDQLLRRAAPLDDSNAESAFGVDVYRAAVFSVEWVGSDQDSRRLG